MKFVASAVALLFCVAAASCGGGGGSGAGPSSNEPPAPPAAATAITSCATIDKSGNYYLDQDLTSRISSRACLIIRDTSNVNLDCKGHTISQVIPDNAIALEVLRSQNFSIKNCQIRSLRTEIQDSSDGTLSQNSFALPSKTGWQINFSYVNVFKSKRILFDSNTLQGGYQETMSESNTVSNNKMTAPISEGISIPALVGSVFSQHTRIIGNTLDGSSDGSTPLVGADDGVAIQDGTDITVENNVVFNTWDCGIEWVGILSNSLIKGNKISNTNLCAIGGWYFMGLQNTTIANNTADKVIYFVFVQRVYGLRAAGSDEYHWLPADEAVWFKNNTFEGNRLTNPNVPGTDAVRLAFSDKLEFNGTLSQTPGERMPAASDFKFANNVFRNNDFGKQIGPNFGAVAPAAGIVVDGGGNLCTPSQQLSYPIQCH